LVEMDGFTQNEGVIVIAATNRPDILDSALLRPGRFDRQIYIGMPDAKAREAILRVHSRSKPLDNSVDYTVVAKTTVGFSPADLENLLNEAALLAARRGKKSVGMPEIDEAVIKVIAGPEKKSRVISEKERRLTAYHEAGHAVVSRFLATQDRVHQISIIPRGRAGGYTLSLPGEDKSYASRSEMFEEIVSLLGGRVAEALTLDDISTGASNDISRSSAIARKMITKYGMSDTLGPITFGSDHDEVFLGRDFATSRNYSEDVAAKIDAEIKAIIDAAYKKCEEILTEHMDAVHAVAKFLLAHEKMEADDFARIFGDELPAHEEAPAPEEAPAAEPIPAAEPAEPENTETDE
ncbi:MAG: AAA family ATPase, partial [Clostridia bacterium]|nr:AAA family ATPase [Clostridia bacterium]